MRMHGDIFGQQLSWILQITNNQRLVLKSGLKINFFACRKRNGNFEDCFRKQLSIFFRLKEIKTKGTLSEL